MKPKQISSASSHETISLRAYKLWQQQGAPEGQDIDFWLLAEFELSTKAKSSESVIDRERLLEFLDSFGSILPSRSPTALNFT